LRRLLAFIPLLWAFHALAAPVCGKYREDRPSGAAQEARTLVFADQNLARSWEQGYLKSISRFQHIGNRLVLRDLDTGATTEYTVQADGTRFETGGNAPFRERYVQEKAASCNGQDRPAQPVCKGDMDACCAAGNEFACIAVASDKGDATALQSLCSKGLPMACAKLADVRDREVARQASHATDKPAAECARTEASEEKCGSLLSRSLLSQMSGVVPDAQLHSTQPWPKAYIEEQLNACRKIDTPGLCNRVAERLWDAGQYLQAKAVLDDACRRKLSEEACRASEGLKKLPPQITPAKATKLLPCGHYVAANKLGLMRSIEFGDRGFANTALALMRARMWEGAVRIRHDKGDDFVLQPLSNQWLLGADPWHRYALFERQGGKANCSPPTASDERSMRDY